MKITGKQVAKQKSGVAMAHLAPPLESPQVMNSCVASLSLFSSDILTWSADSLENKGNACRRICILYQ